MAEHRRKWPRRVIYGLLAPLAIGGLALIIYVYSGHPESYLREALITGLAEVLGRPVAIERIHLTYLPPGVTVEGFTSDGPVLNARRVEASFSLRALLRGRFVIRDVDLYEPLLRWDIDTERFMAPLPPGERKEGGISSKVALRRLRIQGGHVLIGSARRALSAEIEGLSMGADNSSGEPGLAGIKGPWSGSLNFIRARFIFDNLLVDGVSGSVSFESDPEVVHARRLRFRADGFDLSGTGMMQPGTPVRARADLNLLLDPESPALTRPLHQFSAQQMDIDMRLTLSGEGVKVSGQFVAEGPTIDIDRQADSDGPDRPWPARIGRGTFTADARRIDVTGLLESFAGGTIEGTYAGVRAEPDGVRMHQVDLQAVSLSLEQVLRHDDLPGDDAVSPSATLSGRATARWSGPDIDTMTGDASLNFHPVPGDLPVSGKAALAWKGRRVDIVSSSIEAQGSHLEIAGRVDTTGRPMGLRLSGRLVSDDTDPLRIFLERRFGRIPGDPDGRITSTFEVEGTTARPVVRAAFEASELTVLVPESYFPIVLTSAAGRLSYDPDQLSLELDQATAPGAAFTARMNARPGDGGIWRLSSLDLDASELPAEWLVRLASLNAEQIKAVGSVSATASLLAPGGARPLEGPVKLQAGQIDINGFDLTGLKAEGRLAAGRLQLDESTFGLFGGAVSIQGEIGPGSGALDIDASSIDLAAVDAAHPGPSMEGRLAAAGRVTLGDAGSVEATVTGTGIRIAGIDLGQLTGSLSGPLDRVRLELRDETGQLAAAGTFSPGTGASAIDIDATLTVTRLNLEELRPLLPPGALAGLKGDADGLITLHGPVLDPAALEIHALLERVSLTAGDYPLRNEGPISITEKDGFLTLAPTRLVGEKTDLTLGGSMVLGGRHEITARVQGTYDLGLVEILFPDLRASGPGIADLGVIQRGDTLTYTGTLTLDGGTLAHPALPLPMTNLKARGEFTKEGQLQITEAGFDMGGGHATATGWARFEGASLPELHLELTGRGIRAEILPELRAFFDADVTLDKESEAYRFGGKVTILRAIYSRPFGVEASELLLRSREFAPAQERRPGSPEVFVDLDIVADGDVWVRNDDALIEASAHLRLEGTLDKPELSGRISALEGGTYRFRDVTYRIVGGSLDFADFTRIDPVIDIEAATRVQQYEITLRISGRFSRPIYDLIAEPSLPQRDIVWLLLTGRTLAEAPGGETTQNFAEGQVASYLAAPVAGAITSPLEKILGVSSVQIDPFFLNGTADPSARLTITKRVASNMLFTYSSSLGQSGQEIYQVEYNPGRLWDFIATRDIDGSIGGEMRFRRRWLGWRPAPSDSVPQVAGGARRVGRIRILTDLKTDSEQSLARRLPIDENDLFRRGDLLEGRELLRQHYVTHGYPAAEVNVIEEDPNPASPGRVDVTYAIRAGRRHTLEINGDVRERPIRKTVKAAWMEPILLEDLVEEARKATLGLLKGKGYFTAQVEAGIEDPTEEQRLIRLDVQPGPKVHVRNITITGNKGMPTDRIRKQMLTQEDTWISLFGGGLLKEPVLKDDLNAIRGLYLANGYLSVKIAPAEIKLTEDTREADVEIGIEEGPQSRIDTISIEGAAEGVATESLLKAAGLTSSQIVSTQMMEVAADRVREALDKDGYGHSRVTWRLEGEPERTRVIFSITPLDRARVRNVTVEGNTRTQTAIVRREIEIKEGAYLTRASVLATQRNLYRLGVFRSVQVETEPVEGRPGLLNVRIILQEGSPLLTAWGLGYDSLDKTRASFEIANNNLFGTRRAAALFLRGSERDSRVQVTLRDPNLFGEKIETLLSTFLERQSFDSFDLVRYGAAAQLSRKFGEHTTLFGRYRLEDIDLYNLQVSPKETGQQTVKLGSVAASVTHDRRDDIINPTRGGFSTIDARVYHHAVGSEVAFKRLFLSGSWFKHIGRGVVWASSARVGVIREPDLPLLSNVPISERFFAGGDTTLRGFEFNRVGPRDPLTGKHVGGNGLFLINQELRYPVYKALKGVVFYDTGNVYSRGRDYDITNRRQVVGLGLRFDTPVGPFRIEYGRKLDRERFCTPTDCFEDSPGEFFFSIGQAF